MVSGDYVSARVEVDRELKIAITLTVSIHVARQNELSYSEEVTISLLVTSVRALLHFKRAIKNTADYSAAVFSILKPIGFYSAAFRCVVASSADFLAKSA